MDFLPDENSHLALVLCRQGKRKLRTLKNKDNPPRCRRQLFQTTETLSEENQSSGQEIEHHSPTKDWVTCLKSCLEFDDTTSLKQFQSYLQFMNSYENQAANDILPDNRDASGISNQVNMRDNIAADREVMRIDDSLCSYYDANQQNGLVYFNKTNACVLSPNIEITDNGVMLCSENISDDHHMTSSWLTTATPSSGLYFDDVMQSDAFEVDHEEVVQCVSGSFDTTSCYSDDFSGSDEGFPEDFPECSLVHFL